MAMRLTYLVLTHDNPQVLARSLTRLATAGARFFIHVDAKRDMAPFRALGAMEQVTLLEERVPVHWGDFSQVEAILLLLRTAMAAPGPAADYYVLISGSDYPLRSGTYIEEMFAREAGAEFINMVRMPAPGKPLERVETARYPRKMPVRHFLSRVLARLGLARRNLERGLHGLAPWSGSEWWALSRAACGYILDFVDRNPWYSEYFERTFASDEVFIQTVLAQSPFLSRVRRNLNYEDWSEQGSHPARITMEHLEGWRKCPKLIVSDGFGNGEAVIARKFSDSDLALLIQIDQIADAAESNALNSSLDGKLPGA
jgi:hypothetical protein